MKRNCWEVKMCGRQPGGEHEHDLGVCPAAAEDKLDGVHGGVNGGRSCWVIAGTMCKNRVQGTYAQKYMNCRDCEFYIAVRAEEGPNFEYLPQLIFKINA